MNNESSLLIVGGVVLLLLLVAAVVVALVAFRSPSRKGGLGAARLVCISGPSQGKQATFEKGVVTLGRAPGNAIVLDESLASQHHAEVRLRQGAFVLEDLNSVNGVWIDGRRVSQEPLAGGSSFQLGGSTYQLVLPGQQPGEVRRTPPAAQPAAQPGRSTPANLGFVDVGNYQLGKLLAEGGQANVYRAKSKIDGTEVVIKFLNQTFDGPTSQYMAEKFEQQLVIGASIRHPHCVRILGGNSHHNPPYLIEEFLSGGTLTDKMRSGHRFPTAEVTRVIGQVCDALGYLHGRQIIHRDLSPSNIVFDGAGNARVIDFGIAKVAGAATNTMTGMVVGKVRYLSVEQARGTQVRPESDLYSLGIIAYELLTGRVPFEGDGIEVLDMHMRVPPRPPNALVPDIPEFMSRAVLHALEKDPDRRFHNAQEMAQGFGYNMPFNRGEVSRTGASAIKPGVSMGAATISLRVIATGNVLNIKESPTILTRDMVNPSDSSMSRQHGQMVFRDSLWWLSEVPGHRSTNGIYRNGVRVAEDEGQFLSIGDEVRLGDTALRVEA